MIAGGLRLAIAGLMFAASAAMAQEPARPARLNFHSPIPLQLRNFVEAGLTPMEAIQGATLRAAQMQGVADEVGTVSAGKWADVIVVDGDPLQDITVLQHRVAHVVANGRVVK